MKYLVSAVVLLLSFFFSNILNAQPVISSPTDYSLVDETAILTITFTDAENAGPSTYTVTFTELAGVNQLAVSPLSGNVSVAGLVSSGAGPYTITVPAASLADNTVYTLTIDNTSDGAAGASVATIIISTGTALTAGTTTPEASPTDLILNFSFTDPGGGFPPYSYFATVYDGPGKTGGIVASSLVFSPETLGPGPIVYNNEDYYFYIDATDAAGSNVEYSEVAMTTEIATPVITSPIADAISFSLTPTINWTFAGNTTGVLFDVEIDDGAFDFSPSVYSALGLSASSLSHVVASALTAGTEYSVRVTAKKAATSEVVASSDVFFKTGYATPVLNSPLNNAKDVNIGYNVGIKFYSPFPSVPGFYEVEISPNSSFTSSTSYVITNTSAYSNSFDLSALDYYATYYWRVRALEFNPVGTGNYSAWSEIRNFRTMDNYTPELFFPADGAADIPNGNVQLGWGLTNREDFAAFLFPKYKITYDTDPGFTAGDGFDPVVREGINSNTPVFLGLEAGTTYYWKVTTVKDGNEGEDYQYRLNDTSLVIGRTYEIIENMGIFGDFTNVGAPDNNYFTVFTATGTTPTNWAGAKLIVSGDVAESPVWSFTTSGAVVKPTIAYPKDETTVYSQTPILYWYTTGFNPIHEYEIEWTDDPTGSPLSANGTAYAAITNPKKSSIPGMFSYPTPALDGGKHYYWHVRTIIGTTVSDWSDAEDFFTFDGVDAAKPNPAYPTGGVEVYSKFPRLYWTLNGPSQGLLYEVYYGPTLATGEVDTSGTEGTDWYKITGISQLYVTLYDGIVGGSTYYWQIRSWNGTTYSDFSDYAEFSIYDFSADLIPILSWPIGGNLVYSTDVNFAWHVEGPSLGITYEMDIAVDATGGTDVDGVADHTGLTSNLLTLSLSSGTSYEWRVRVEGETTWSDIETFTVISGGGSTVPVLNWPVGGATVWSTSQDLGWTLIGGGSPTFEVQVFTDAGLTTHFGASPFTGVSDDSYTLTGLTAGATYYWRVRVEPSEPWSNVEVFTVFAGLSPAAPLAGSPADGVELNKSSATLSWFSPTYQDHAVMFEVEYADNASMTDSKVVGELSSPSIEVTDLKAGNYFWRSRALNDDGTYSTYSDIANFKVTGVTGVENEEGLPQNYELSQNYPNPFNPSTQIKFSLPEANHVTLKIYNMLGQEIRTLINNQSNAGVYTVNWNGRDNYGHKVSSGAYIYQLVSGEFVQSKKLILLK